MKPYVFLRFELSDPKTQHLVGLITESIQVGTMAMEAAWLIPSRWRT